jgi:hypothetical protein
VAWPAETIRSNLSAELVPTQVAFSQERRFRELDLDRKSGCIRDMEHAYSKDGGLALIRAASSDNRTDLFLFDAEGRQKPTSV